MRVRVFCLSILASLVLGLPAEADRIRFEIDRLDDRARIIRDADGVVHIFARTEHDLVFLQGWVHARDRLFQMDTLRRTASGTLAELLGDGALASDVQLRTFGLRRAGERALDVLSPQSLAAIDAYAAGVNEYALANPLPPEYTALELTTFEPWTAIDTLAVAKLFAFSLSFDLQDDIDRTVALQTYQATGAALGFDGAALFFEDVNRAAPFDPASTIPDASIPTTAMASAAGRGTGKTTLVPEGVAGMAREYLEHLRSLPHVDRVARDADDDGGSNEWAVSGALTRSGRPLLANDPHLTLDTPSIFYPIHLRAPRAGFDAIGSSFPGAPYVILGNNRRLAWGATVNRMDATDVFQETIAPDATSPAGIGIVYDGAVEPIIPLPQVFRVNLLNGTPDTVVPVPPGGPIPDAVLIVPRRNNGPIFSADLAAGTALSVMYSGFSGTREIDAFRGFNLARDLDDFVDAVQSFDVGSQNFAVADVRGDIAHFTSAEMPVRADLQAGIVAGVPPFFIRDGSTSSTDWLAVANPQPAQSIPFEILPFAEMPQIVNPPAGFFVNANNDPAGLTLDNDPLNQLRPGGGIFYLEPRYNIGLRAGRITRLLREKLALGPLTADDMREIQADAQQADAVVLVPFLLDAFDAAEDPVADPALAALASDPRIVEAIDRLADWDGGTPTGLKEGWDAADEDGVRSPPSQGEIDASVANTIYTIWRGRIIANTIDATLDPLGLPRPGRERTLIALRHLLDTYPASQGIGASGLDFFQVPGIADAETERDILLLQSLSEALDLLAGDAFANAFGNSTDQDDYRWGRLHRIVLDSPLGGPFSQPPQPPPPGNLPGFATDGGYQTVDPADHDLRAADDGSFMYGAGASRRYVADFGSRRRIEARSSLPGGPSGDIFSPFFDTLLDRWLTNDTYLLRQRPSDVFRGAVEILTVRPPRDDNDDEDDDGDDDDDGGGLD